MTYLIIKITINSLTLFVFNFVLCILYKINDVEKLVNKNILKTINLGVVHNLNLLDTGFFLMLPLR